MTEQNNSAQTIGSGQSAEMSEMSTVQQTISEVNQMFDQDEYNTESDSWTNNENHSQSETVETQVAKALLMKEAEWILSQRLSPIAIAPKNENILKKDGKPLYSGKSPGFLRSNTGNDADWTFLKWGEYSNKQPSIHQIKVWFNYPGHRLGMICTPTHRVIDIDLKQFSSQAECDRFYRKLMENPQLEVARVEQTPGGGYHIFIALPEGNTEKYKLFAAEPGGTHLGEVIGASDGYVVTAPSEGYRTIQQGGFAPIESLASIGIFSKVKEKVQKEKREKVERKVSEHTDGKVCIERLVSNATLDLMMEADGDRSNCFATVANELYGWENWLTEQEIDFSTEVADILNTVGESYGFDSGRIEYCLQAVKREECEPAIFAQNRDASCWAKLSLRYPETVVPKEFTADVKGIQAGWFHSGQEVEKQIGHQELFNQARAIYASAENNLELKIDLTKLCKAALGYFQPSWIDDLIEKFAAEGAESQVKTYRTMKVEGKEMNPRMIYKNKLGIMMDRYNQAKGLINTPMGVINASSPFFASMIGSKASLTTHKGRGWKNEAVVWNSLFGDTSQGKDVHLASFELTARKLEEETGMKFSAARAEYKDYKASHNPKDGGQSLPQKLREIIQGLGYTEQQAQEMERIPQYQRLISSGTIEGVGSVVQNARRGEGIVWCNGEAVSIFQAFGKYSQKSNERSTLNSTWAKARWEQRNKTAESINAPCHLSLMWALHISDVKREQYLDFTHDSVGFTARFNICNLNNLDFSKEKEKDNEYAVSAFEFEIDKIFRYLLSKDFGDISLSPDAFAAFNEFSQEIRSEIENLSGDEAYKNYLGKAVEKASREALIIHCVSSFYDVGGNSSVLSLDTMRVAIALQRFYNNEYLKARYLMGMNAENKKTNELLDRIEKYAETTWGKLQDNLKPKKGRKGGYSADQLGRELSKLKKDGLIDWDGKREKGSVVRGVLISPTMVEYIPDLEEVEPNPEPKPQTEPRPEPEPQTEPIEDVLFDRFGEGDRVYVLTEEQKDLAFTVLELNAKETTLLNTDSGEILTFPLDRVALWEEDYGF
jgi:hypothetical protein